MWFSSSSSQKISEILPLHSDILCSDTASQITLFSRECFLCHYGGQVKTAVKQRRREGRLEKIRKKRKRNNLKMPRLCAVFNCSNCADREKDKSNYHFPKMLKIIGKKA